jgi:hypothetical protein
VGGVASLQPALNPPKPKLKKKFVDIIISEVLRDLPFSRNQLLKWADD